MLERNNPSVVEAAALRLALITSALVISITVAVNLSTPVSALPSVNSTTPGDPPSPTCGPA